MSPPSPKAILLSSMAIAVVSTGIGVTVNLATEWKTEWWPWAAAGALTVIIGMIAAWATQRASVPVVDEAREFDSDDVVLKGHAIVRPRKGTAVRVRRLRARDNASFIVDESVESVPDGSESGPDKA